MRVLQLTAHFRPNIGGVETHLDDLCKVLVNKGFGVFVLTYRPLQTKVNWGFFEEGKNIEILRIPWVSNLFYKLVKTPVLEFIYLVPGLFFMTPFILFLRKIEVIHAHGLIAGFVGVFWGRVFGKRVIVSTHSIYNFPKSGFYVKFVGWIFNSADFCLGLSKQAAVEIRSLGVLSNKVDNFTYWIDLEKFKKMENAKNKLGWRDRFTVLFVGRLVVEKGVTVLLQSIEDWDKNIALVIIGSGPLEQKVKEASAKFENIKFTGIVCQDNLALYYSASDILVVPSTSEEGFGRVILEALACGTPVIGASNGAIGEAMDISVGELIDISPGNIKNAVEGLYKNRSRLKKLARNCRNFAERKYSEKNADTIIKIYQG